MPDLRGGKGEKKAIVGFCAWPGSHRSRAAAARRPERQGLEARSAPSARRNATPARATVPARDSFQRGSVSTRQIFAERSLTSFASTSRPAVADHLDLRRVVARDHRRAAVHRLEQRQPEPFVRARGRRTPRIAGTAA